MGLISLVVGSIYDANKAIKQSQAKANDSVHTIKVKNLYSIDVPDFMTPMKGLNDDASLQYGNKTLDVGMLVIDEPKSEFLNEFEELQKEVPGLGKGKSILENMATVVLNNYFEDVDKIELSNRKTFKINGLNALSLNAFQKRTFLKDAMYCYFVFVEGATMLYQILMISGGTSIVKLSSKLERSVMSFRELGSGDKGTIRPAAKPASFSGQVNQPVSKSTPSGFASTGGKENAQTGQDRAALYSFITLNEDVISYFKGIWEPLQSMGFFSNDTLAIIGDIKSNFATLSKIKETYESLKANASPQYRLAIQQFQKKVDSLTLASSGVILDELLALDQKNRSTASQAGGRKRTFSSSAREEIGTSPEWENNKMRILNGEIRDNKDLALAESHVDEGSSYAFFSELAKKTNKASVLDDVFIYAKNAMSGGRLVDLLWELVRLGKSFNKKEDVLIELIRHADNLESLTPIKDYCSGEAAQFYQNKYNAFKDRESRQGRQGEGGSSSKGNVSAVLFIIIIVAIILFSVFV